MEVAVTSLSADLGPRLSRYANALPLAAYVVADVVHRRLLVHTAPRPADDPRAVAYDEHSAIGPGASLRLRLDGRDLEPIPYEEVMR